MIACSRFAGLSAVAVISVHTVPVWGAEAVRPTDLMESAAFLETYRAASARREADFYDLYSDHALVHVRVGPEQPDIVFDGRAFKRWGRSLLEAGRISLDGSTFREATVEQRGSRLIIRAKRYSTRHCYWDAGYQMSIEREGAAYRIVDERLAPNLESHCPEFGPLMTSSPIAPAPFLNLAERSPELAALSAEHAWHPLSEAELQEQAVRIAQQIVGARAAAPASQQADAESGIANSSPHPLSDGVFITLPSRLEPPAPIVTSQETP